MLLSVRPWMHRRLLASSRCFELRFLSRYPDHLEMYLLQLTLKVNEASDARSFATGRSKLACGTETVGEAGPDSVPFQDGSPIVSSRQTC